MPQKNVNLQRITEICEKTARRFDYELCGAALYFPESSAIIVPTKRAPGAPD